MKKILLVCMAVFLLCAGNAFAAGISIDVFGNYNSEPIDEFGSAIGFGAGVTYDLSEIAVENLAARVDVSYAKWTWDWDFLGSSTELTVTRIPIFAGVRYNAPLEAPVKVFGEAGLEISMDTVEAGIVFLGQAITSEADDTNFGGAIGAGVAYPINETISIGANARYHLITDSYFSGGLFVGFTIPQ